MVFPLSDLKASLSLLPRPSSTYRDLGLRKQLWEKFTIPGTGIIKSRQNSWTTGMVRHGLTDVVALAIRAHIHRPHRRSANRISASRMKCPTDLARATGSYRADLLSLPIREGDESVDRAVRGIVTSSVDECHYRLLPRRWADVQRWCWRTTRMRRHRLRDVVTLSVCPHIYGPHR